MLPPDPDIANRLQSASQRLFPSQVNPRVANLSRISDGWECDVFSFILESGDDPAPIRNALILRLYQGNGAARKASAEFDVLRRLNALGYPVPRVLTVVVDDSPFDRPCVVMEKIEGPVLGQSMEAASGDERLALLRRFGKLVVDFHRLDWREVAPDVPVEETVRPIDRWLAEAETILRRLATQDFDPAIDWLKAHRRDVTSIHLSAVHQDFHPWNVLLDSRGKAYVIDWTQIHVSDYRLDLAWTLLLLRAVFGREIRDQLLSEYERLAGAPVENISYFEAIAAAKRLASIYISLTAGAEALGMRPGAESRMLEDPGHLRTARDLLLETTGLSLPAIESLLRRRPG